MGIVGNPDPESEHPIRLHIVADCERLFIHAKPTGVITNPENPIQLHTLPFAEKFYFTSLICETAQGKKVADLNEIEAEFDTSVAILRIKAPLISCAPNAGSSAATTPLATTTPAPTPSLTNITVACNVGWGKTLGVCCTPNWAEAPIAFTAINGEEWYGQVPMDKEFKFVILENGKPVAWENGENRRSSANLLHINQVHF